MGWGHWTWDKNPVDGWKLNICLIQSWEGLSTIPVQRLPRASQAIAFVASGNLPTADFQTHSRALLEAAEGIFYTPSSADTFQNSSGTPHRSFPAADTSGEIRRSAEVQAYSADVLYAKVRHEITHMTCRRVFTDPQHTVLPR